MYVYIYIYMYIFQTNPYQAISNLADSHTLMNQMGRVPRRARLTFRKYWEFVSPTGADFFHLSADYFIYCQENLSELKGLKMTEAVPIPLSDLWFSQDENRKILPGRD